MIRKAIAALGLLSIGLFLGYVFGRTGPTVSDVLNSWNGPIPIDASAVTPRQKEVAEKLELRAKFVRGTELGELRRMLGGSLPTTNRLERQIYLVACLRPQEYTGPRVPEVVLEVVQPDVLAGMTITLKGGLLDDDCIYHVQLMIDTDRLLPGDAGSRGDEYLYDGPDPREAIVKSSPKFRVVSLQSQ